MQPLKNENSLDVCFPRNVKVMIIQSPYYKTIAENLLKGATLTLEGLDVAYDVVDVPGALEAAAAIEFVEKSAKHYDAYVVLGCIIRGESYHFEIVCNESARKIYDLVEKYNLALGNGILTVENMGQAEARSVVDGRNNGKEAVNAALKMLLLKFELGLVE